MGKRLPASFNDGRMGFTACSGPLIFEAGGGARFAFVKGERGALKRPDAAAFCSK